MNHQPASNVDVNDVELEKSMAIAFPSHAADAAGAEEENKRKPQTGGETEMIGKSARNCAKVAKSIVTGTLTRQTSADSEGSNLFGGIWIRDSWVC